MQSSSEKKTAFDKYEVEYDIWKEANGSDSCRLVMLGSTVGHDEALTFKFKDQLFELLCPIEDDGVFFVEGKSSWTTFVNDYTCSTENITFTKVLDKIFASLTEYSRKQLLRSQPRDVINEAKLTLHPKAIEGKEPVIVKSGLSLLGPLLDQANEAFKDKQYRLELDELPEFVRPKTAKAIKLSQMLPVIIVMNIIARVDEIGATTLKVTKITASQMRKGDNALIRACDFIDKQWSYINWWCSHGKGISLFLPSVLRRPGSTTMLTNESKNIKTRTGSRRDKGNGRLMVSTKKETTEITPQPLSRSRSAGTLNKEREEEKAAGERKRHHRSKPRKEEDEREKKEGETDEGRKRTSTRRTKREDGEKGKGKETQEEEKEAKLDEKKEIEPKLVESEKTPIDLRAARRLPSPSAPPLVHRAASSPVHPKRGRSKQHKKDTQENESEVKNGAEEEKNEPKEKKASGEKRKSDGAKKRRRSKKDDGKGKEPENETADLEDDEFEGLDLNQLEVEQSYGDEWIDSEDSEEERKKQVKEPRRHRERREQEERERKEKEKVAREQAGREDRERREQEDRVKAEKDKDKDAAAEVEAKKKSVATKIMKVLKKEYPPMHVATATYSVTDLDNSEALIKFIEEKAHIERGSEKEPKYYKEILSTLKDEGYLSNVQIPKEVLIKHGGAPVSAALKLNFFVSLAAFIRKRLLNFDNYCLICHSKHRCTRDAPVVCCKPLCLFRYQDMRELHQVLECEVCPYLGCSQPEDLLQEQNAIKALYPTPEKIVGIQLEQLVKLHNHKYLPDKELASILSSGLHHGFIKSIVNILQADLVPRFEKLWLEYQRKYPHLDIKPKLGWHGTKECYINSIVKKGLIVPGRDGVTHSCDTGWWGKGIYISPFHTYSMGYMYGGSKGLFLCSILLGKPKDITHRIDGQPCTPGYDSHIAQGGNEWVLFDEAQVLPCYLIEVQR